MPSLSDRLGSDYPLRLDVSQNSALSESHIKGWA